MVILDLTKFVQIPPTSNLHPPPPGIRHWRTAKCAASDLPPLWDNTLLRPNRSVYYYLDNVEFVCTACYTSDGGSRARARHMCQADGTWVAHKGYTQPFCVLKCQDDEEYCSDLKDYCYVPDLAEELWQSCAATCNVPAQCNGELNAPRQRREEKGDNSWQSARLMCSRSQGLAVSINSRFTAVPISIPRLGHQRPCYVLSCLW
ncbi:uncharacterized protein LOC121387172 [Gigantopelta aegis]|uniref:uncharacterized protein LOC121387172 n=1 Tax=Gigantopelta aegis TaxID=1735272 RepID=UPI001B889C1F|nr:uncharacterized protein LOC121387172 [Gigantopelta aegis]